MSVSCRVGDFACLEDDDGQVSIRCVVRSEKDSIASLLELLYGLPKQFRLLVEREPFHVRISQTRDTRLLDGFEGIIIQRVSVSRSS